VVEVVGFTGRAVSSGSIPFALSGTPQQFRKDKKPRDFFGFCICADWEDVALTVAGVLSTAAGDVIDLLLLVKLPLRFSPMMLVDFLEPPPMLPVGSLAVAPLRAVAVGEGCILCDDDREGTCRRV
jgi:hypothetical protein